MNGVCCYDGASLPVARFGNTVARETTRGDEGSYRQSADGLWVDPFKHDLPLSCFFIFFYFYFLSQSPHQPMSLHHFISEAEMCFPSAFITLLRLLQDSTCTLFTLCVFSMDITPLPILYLLDLAPFYSC